MTKPARIDSPGGDRLSFVRGSAIAQAKSLERKRTRYGEGAQNATFCAIYM